MHPPNFLDDGYSIHADVVPVALRAPLERAFDAVTLGRAGFRGGLQLPAVRELASCAEVRALVEPVLGPSAIAFRATLFDKTPAANWLVAWHQDRVVPVREQVPAPGFSCWSRKDGVWHVEPPASVLQNLLAIRIDLDGSTVENGALRVLPGTHRDGVLSAADLRALAARTAVVCEVPAGGAMCMRPLLVHASSRASTPDRRRIVHVEFAAGRLSGVDFADTVP